MKNMMAEILILVAFATLGCSVRGLKGTYHASVPFRDGDPRFVGQVFDWDLNLKGDATFSFTYSEPMAVWGADGQEMVGKTSGQVSGQWKQVGKTVLLTRTSGGRYLGTTSTRVFYFHNNEMPLQLSHNSLILREADTQVELKRTP